MRTSQRLLVLVLLLAGVTLLFAQGGGQAAALPQFSASQVLMSSQRFPIDVAVDQISSTTSKVTTATVTATSTSRVTNTKTATTTVSTTTSYVDRTKMQITFTTSTTYLDYSKTTTATNTVSTTTSYSKRTATTTAPTTVSTTTSYSKQTATATAPTTVSTTTSYVSQTATATSTATNTLSATTTTFVCCSTQTVTATSSTTTTSTASTVHSSPTGLLVPLFIYPTTVSTWSSIASLPAAYPNVPVIAIINPANGPGTQKDPNYVAGINSLKVSGVVTIGYVYTNYGAVSLQSVETSIDEWKNLYGVTGIFLDAMAYTPGYESYYQSIVSYAKVTDGMSIVIGNPGTETVASYVGNGGVDNIGFYEDFGTPTIAYLSSPFHTSYPKTEWSFLAHGVATLNDSFVAQASQYVNYLYISSGPGSAPWGAFPTYLDQMAADLAKVNPSAAISAAPSNANSSVVKNYQQEVLSARILSNTRRIIFQIVTEAVRLLSNVSHSTYLSKFCFNLNLQRTFR